MLARIAKANPRIYALANVMNDEAPAAAEAADRALASGGAIGPLHGVPVTIKVNVDTAGLATTDGIVAAAGNIAATDKPLVAHLRAAVAAAAAMATGMGPIAQGNDHGGSVRDPAWACGVVGLRTTVGRLPSYKASATNRTPTNQMMSVQGPLTRNVAGARLALAEMAQGSPLDPNWLPAPLEDSDNGRALRVAVFKRHAAFDTDPSAVAAIEQAAGWSVQEALAR